MKISCSLLPSFEHVFSLLANVLNSVMELLNVYAVQCSLARELVKALTIEQSRILFFKCNENFLDDIRKRRCRHPEVAIERTPCTCVNNSGSVIHG